MEKSTAISSKKIVGLSSAVKRAKVSLLVPYKSSSDEETNDQEARKGPAILKNGGTSTPLKSRKFISSEERTLSKSFLMWENTANVCWLDASMALIVHNQTLIESLEDSSSQIGKIVKFYYEAVSILNDCSDERHIDVRVKAAKDMLKSVQDTVLKYLQPILKYKEGEPDSAFCALYNLISEDKSIKAYFEVEFTWVQTCKECENHRAKKHKKPIVTLPKVINFQAQCPVAIYQCPVCKEPDQKMTLNFRTLPQCLLFHFESGAGTGELKFNDFEVDRRTYRLTGVITLEKAKESLVNHFITFVRDPVTDTWLECNDLNDEVMCFCMVPPILELEDIYILMYEAADSCGTVTNRSLSVDKRGLGEESVSGSADIPLIDLADDTDKETNDNGRRCNQPREVTKKYRNAGLIENSEDDPSISLQETAFKNSSSPSITNGVGVLSEINPSKIFESLDIENKDAVLGQVNRHSTNVNQVTFQSESITFAEDACKPSSEIFMNGICQDSIAKQRIVKISNMTGNINPNLNELQEADENQNTLPTLFEVNDASKQATPESESKVQITNKTYKQRLHTLEASLMNSLIPPHNNAEDGKENVADKVPIPKPHAESGDENQTSEVDETKCLLKLSKHFNSEIPSSDCDLDPPGPKTEEHIKSNEKTTETQSLQKNVNISSNCELDPAETKEEDLNNSIVKTTEKQRLHDTVENTHSNQTGKLLRSHDCKNQQNEQKPKDLNSQIVPTDFEEEPKSSVVSVSENGTSHSDATKCERKLRPRQQSKAEGYLKCTTYKTQANLVPEKSNSDVVMKSVEKESVGDAVEEESIDLNTKIRRCKNDTVSTSKKQEKNVEKVQPMRRSRRSSSCVSESTVKEIQNPVSADASNFLVKKRVTRKRSRTISTSSEGLDDIKFASVDTDKPLTLDKMGSFSVDSNKSSVVESGKSFAVETCNFVERKAKVKRKKANSKSPEVSHNLAEKYDNLRPKRGRAKSSELFDDVMEHSENVKTPKKLSRKRNVDVVRHESTIKQHNKDVSYMPIDQFDVDQNTLPEGCDDLMEQSKNAKKLQCKRCLESDSPKPTTKQNMKNNSFGYKSDSNQNTCLNFSNASVKLKENPSEELLPSYCDNKRETLKNDVSKTECTVDCDCIPHDMDELIDIEVDSILLSIVRGFGIRKCT